MARGYVEQSLQSGERVYYRAKLHWIIFVPALIFTALASVVALNASNSAALRLGLVLAGAFMIVAAWVRRATTEIAVTDRRFIFKVGLLRRITGEINAEKIEGVEVRQSVIGRLFNYGTVIVKGIGLGYEPVRSVARPLNLQIAANEVGNRNKANLSSTL